MLPEVTEVEVNIQTTEETQIGTSFLFDFTLGDFVLQDGRVKKVSDLDALKVWIEKVIKTEKRKFKIYQKEADADEYGVTIQDLIVGQDLPQDFIEAELERELSEELTKHQLIESISNFTVTKDNPRVIVSFTVNLVTGTSFGQEVSING